MFARPRALRQEPIALGTLLRDTASLIERDPTMLNLEISVSGACRHRRRSRDAADCVSEHPDERRAGDGGPGTDRRHDCRRRTDAAASPWPIADPGCPQTSARKRSTRSSRRSIAARVSGCRSRSASSKPTAARCTSTCRPRGAPLFRWICRCRLDARSSRGDAAGQRRLIARALPLS